MFRKRSAKILHTSKKKYKIEKQRKKSKSRREMGGEDWDTIEEGRDKHKWKFCSLHYAASVRYLSQLERHHNPLNPLNVLQRGRLQIINDGSVYTPYLDLFIKIFAWNEKENNNLTTEETGHVFPWAWYPET